jgi:hypothetical protein
VCGGHLPQQKKQLMHELLVAELLLLLWQQKLALEQADMPLALSQMTCILTAAALQVEQPPALPLLSRTASVLLYLAPA